MGRSVSFGAAAGWMNLDDAWGLALATTDVLHKGLSEVSSVLVAAPTLVLLGHRIKAADTTGAQRRPQYRQFGNVESDDVRFPHCEPKAAVAMPVFAAALVRARTSQIIAWIQILNLPVTASRLPRSSIVAA
jgi:hypothetical protein